MHNLANRGLETFLRSNYGGEAWADIALHAGIKVDEFATWRSSTDIITGTVVVSAAKHLKKPPGELLEDIGEWLTQQEQIRRLLRFSGSSFEEFVYSLQDISGRINLVVPDLKFSDLHVQEPYPRHFRIMSGRDQRHAMRVLMGALRGMADDFGTLAVVTRHGNRIEVDIAVIQHAQEKEFDLVPAGQ